MSAVINTPKRGRRRRQATAEKRAGADNCQRGLAVGNDWLMQAVLLVQLRKPLYKGRLAAFGGEIPAGTMMRVETLNRWGVVEVSPISRPGQRIFVTDSEVTAVGPDCVYDAMSWRMLGMEAEARWAGNVRLASVLRRRWVSHWVRKGIPPREICTPGCELVPYAGGGL